MTHLLLPVLAIVASMAVLLVILVPLLTRLFGDTDNGGESA